MLTCLQTLEDSASSSETCRITSGVYGDILRVLGLKLRYRVVKLV